MGDLDSMGLCLMCPAFLESCPKLSQLGWLGSPLILDPSLSELDLLSLQLAAVTSVTLTTI